jgi:hypothetical protein
MVQPGSGVVTASVLAMLLAGVIGGGIVGLVLGGALASQLALALLCALIGAVLPPVIGYAILGARCRTLGCHRRFIARWARRTQAQRRPEKPTGVAVSWRALQPARSGAGRLLRYCDLRAACPTFLSQEVSARTFADDTITCGTRFTLT